MAKSTAKEVKFIELCEILEETRMARKHSDRYEILEGFFKMYRKIGEDIKRQDPAADVSFFPLLRLLVPQLERERPSYGLNKFALRRTLSKLLCLSKDSDNFKKLGSDEYDFAETAYSLLRKHFSKSSNLTILQINEYLDAIASKQVANNASHRDNMFLKLFQETSPEEQKWLIRVILKKMGLRIGDTKILNMYHPHASMCLNDTNSLLTVCNTLTDPNITVTDSEITLFTHFRPMLNRRCDAKELFKVVTDTKQLFVETKFDGERFQLHMENDRFKYFSRNGYDFSKKFGETYNSGLYTPLLQGVFNDNVKSIILDGEMMGWNRNTREFGSKGMNFDVKNLSDTSIHQPCFCVFDILFFNGKLISKLPLKDRVGILKDAFTEHEGIIQQSTRREAYSKEDIIRALNNSMDNKEEGIVFKDPDSTYIPNSRNGGWWKMKLEYFSGVMSDLDVIIMGGFFGKNNKIDGFIIGVSVPIDSTRKKFLSFAKVTTGLSFDEWETIRKRLDPHWIKTFGDNYENYNLNFGKMKPDVWIPPTKSCILLVRATELTKTAKVNSDFKTPYTLRFARIETIRFDKPYDDCLTLTEMEELVSSGSSVHKLYNNHLCLEDIEHEVQKIKKFKPKFVDSTVEIEEKLSDILMDYEFCVLSGSTNWEIKDVERVIKENGGTIVKTEGDNTYCILAGEKHIRLEYYKGSVDIVKLSWLQKVIDCRQMQPYSPEDMIYISPKTKHRFLRNYDKYGDSFTDKATKYSLENVFNNIKEKGDYVCPLPAEIHELHNEINVDKKFNIFEKYMVYFDKYKVINNPQSEVIYDSSLDESVLKFWGGKSSKALTPSVNLIITFSNDENRKNEILSHYCYVKAADIVSMSFLEDKIYNRNCSNEN